MINDDIRILAKESGVKLWEIAEQLGWADATLSRKLRHELPASEIESITDAINEIAIMKIAGFVYEKPDGSRKSPKNNKTTWIPIDDKSPTFINHIDSLLTPPLLVCTKNGEVLIAIGKKIRGQETISWISYCVYADDPTEIEYWMYLPKCPESRSE